MSQNKPELTDDQHLQCGKALFNYTWLLLDKTHRSVEEDDELIFAANASAYHWRQIGEPVNFARSHWQVSRVYAMLKRAEPALFHARRSLQVCEEHDIGDFDYAFAHEALARAFSLAGEPEAARTHLGKARAAATGIADEDDRTILMNDLSTIKPD